MHQSSSASGGAERTAELWGSTAIRQRAFIAFAVVVARALFIAHEKRVRYLFRILSAAAPQTIQSTVRTRRSVPLRSTADCPTGLCHHVFPQFGNLGDVSNSERARLNFRFYVQVSCRSKHDISDLPRPLSCWSWRPLFLPLPPVRSRKQDGDQDGKDSREKYAVKRPGPSDRGNRSSNAFYGP